MPTSIQPPSVGFSRHQLQAAGRNGIKLLWFAYHLVKCIVVAKHDHLCQFHSDLNAKVGNAMTVSVLQSVMRRALISIGIGPSSNLAKPVIEDVFSN